MRPPSQRSAPGSWDSASSRLYSAYSESLKGESAALRGESLRCGEGSLPRLKLEVWERSLPLPAMREPRAVHPGAAERGRETGQWANWLPWADRLLIGAVTAAILLVLFPIALAGSVSSLWGEQLPAAACSGSAIALAGCIPALLAHYTYDFRHPPKWLQKPPMWLQKLVHAKADPEFAERVVAERVIVIASVILGVAAAVGSFFLTS